MAVTYAVIFTVIALVSIAVVKAGTWLGGSDRGLCPNCKEEYLHQSRDAWFCRFCGRIL